ncbi:MAG: energy transducer TonB [Sphingomonas sp.]|nr:energy transducer TonB [Sphingomonas sp.]
MLILLLAYAAATQAPPAATTQGAVNVVKLFSYDDYPAEAVRNRWQGDVVVELTVGGEGRATACNVVRSSGYKVLDDATCTIMVRRARFMPPVDAQGRPVATHVIAPPIRWRISG